MSDEEKQLWFHAEDRHAEQWHFGGYNRRDAIQDALGYYGDVDFYITTGHPSDPNNEDDCPPEDFPYTMDNKPPELIPAHSHTE